MPIVVEDGTGVAGANSYIDEAYVTAFASSRGLTAPATTVITEAYILKAMDYLSFYRDSFQGNKSVSTNALPWPRKKVIIDGFAFLETDIPEELQQAQAQLVIEQTKGTPLYLAPIVSPKEGQVTEKTVGPLTKKFAQSSNTVGNSNRPVKIMEVEVFLRPLLSNNVLRTCKV